MLNNTIIAEIMDKTGLTLGQIGDTVGLGKAAMSQLKNGKYTNQKSWESIVVRKLKEAHKLDNIELELLEMKGELSVDIAAFINTQNVIAVDSLGEGLLNTNNTLNSSLGLITGTAGYGKTTALKHFVANHERSAYVLFVEGYTLTYLVKEIAHQLRGVSASTFAKNVEIIKDSTQLYRKLLIVDEADRLPIKYIESLRGINEVCGLPIIFAGEETLASKMRSEARIASRIRKPEIAFAPIDPIDVATFYKSAIGLDITENPIIAKTLCSWAKKDFRNVVNDAQHICEIMNINGVKELNMEVLDAYRSHR